MIQPSELRIGNYVYNVNNVICCSINTIFAISKIVPPTMVYSPIPLTEEWLVKFGLTRGVNDADRNVFYSTSSHKIQFSVLISGRFGLYVHGTFIVIPELLLESAHQLQNLYFALTGKELTIKND